MLVAGDGALGGQSCSALPSGRSAWRGRRAADYTFELSEAVVNEGETGSYRAGFNDLRLTLTPLPEPGSLLLLGVAAATLAMRRRPT